MNLLALSLCFTFTSQSNCTAEFPSEQEIKREQKAHKKEGVCGSVREVERDIEMRRGSRFGIHVFLILVGVLSSQRSAPGRKSHVLVSKIFTGITGIETQIIYDNERWLWQQLTLSLLQLCVCIYVCDKMCEN